MSLVRSVGGSRGCLQVGVHGISCTVLGWRRASARCVALEEWIAEMAVAFRAVECSRRSRDPSAVI